jgi:hypothetical protein
MPDEPNGPVDTVSKYVGRIMAYYSEVKAEKHLFFRGQYKASYGLIPSALREKWRDKEKAILLDFCNYADVHGVSYDKVYEIDKLLGDMQHYRLPTRFLDWSVSPLVALFCACKRGEDESEKDCKEDGAVYIFNPWRYRKDILHIATHCDKEVPNNHQIQILSRALLAYGWHYDEIVKYLEKRYPVVKVSRERFQYPYPTVSAFSNDRKLHQRGTFLVWGEDTGFDIKHQIKQKDSIIIPHNAKGKILEELNKLYINEYTVYPDYVGMRKMMESRGSLFNVGE